MTKEEYLKIAESQWEALQSLELENNFYDYEKKLDETMVKLGQQLMDKQLGGSGEDRRKKKKFKPDTGQ